MIYFDKYIIGDWKRCDNCIVRHIRLDGNWFGEISITQYTGYTKPFQIAFGYNSYCKIYPILSEYKLFYSQESDIFLAATQDEAKNKIDTFLIKFNKLKAFV